MKRFFYILSSLCCLTCIQAIESEPSHADLQKKLDYTVKYRSRHHAEKEKRIDDLKNLLRQATSDKERFELYSRLYEMYIAYQTDSALNYIRKKEALLTHLTDDTYRYDTQLNLIGVMTVTGMYKEALDVLTHIPHQELPENMKQG